MRYGEACRLIGFVTLPLLDRDVHPVKDAARAGQLQLGIARLRAFEQMMLRGNAERLFPRFKLT